MLENATCYCRCSLLASCDKYWRITWYSTYLQLLCTRNSVVALWCSTSYRYITCTTFAHAKSHENVVLSFDAFTTSYSTYDVLEYQYYSTSYVLFMITFDTLVKIWKFATTPWTTMHLIPTYVDQKAIDSLQHYVLCISKPFALKWFASSSCIRGVQNGHELWFVLRINAYMHICHFTNHINRFFC